MRPTLVALFVLASTIPLALALDPEETGLTGAATAMAPVGTIQHLLRPLSAAPSFVKVGDASFVVESDRTDVVRVTLTDGKCKTDLGAPSFSTSAVPSGLWPGRFVHQHGAALPAWIAPGLYGVGVEFADGKTENQPRALAVVAAYNPTPRIAIVADPQVGDPRAMQDALEDSKDEMSMEPFLFAGEKTMFNYPAEWRAFSDAADAINALDVDFVLVTGDITFGQDAPGKYLTEYELAWTILQEFEAPTFMSLGNHDGYVQSGVDGFELWQKYFGPLHYAADYGPGVHIVSLNTYDWSELDRMGISFGVSAWGGQIRSDQAAWLDADLAAYRAGAPEGVILTFAHHNPSWVQDVWPCYECGVGAPVAEQVLRAAISYGTTDQGWSGEGRMALRSILRSHGVDVHFGGHTHRDRVARDDAGVGIVETTQKKVAGLDPKALHYVLPNDTFVTTYSQTQLAAKMHDASRGPFYVDSTTAASGTNEYLGFRLVDLVPDGAGGFELAEFGWTPPSQAWLEEHARDPSFWNAAHAEFGLFSVPLYAGS